MTGLDERPGRTAWCRSCGAQIVWGTNTATGRPAPIDAAPSERGNISCYPAADGPRLVVLGAAKASAMRAAGQLLYLSHFATCPQAGKWRRER